MYVFIYRLKSENFEHDHYMNTGGSTLWEAFVYFYASLVEGEEGFLSPTLLSKTIRFLGSPMEMLDFFTSVTLENVKIVDVFSNCNRIDISPA